MARSSQATKQNIDLAQQAGAFIGSLFTKKTPSNNTIQTHSTISNNNSAMVIKQQSAVKKVTSKPSYSSNSADESIISGSDGYDYSNNGFSADGSSNGNGSSSSDSVGSQATEEELAFIKKMRNTYGINYRQDPVGSKARRENDLYYTPNQKLNSYWQLTEEVYLYTFHDKKIHRYLTSFQIDSDKNDIMSTCQIEFPYRSELMEYWVPGSNAFAIIGGTFDREIFFMGRVSEVNQVGDTIEMVGQNLGYKFKEYMNDSFMKKIQGLKVKQVIKLIFAELGILRYRINLDGIPKISKYTIDENGSVLKDGETVENIPDLETVISNIEEDDVKLFQSINIETKETQKSADEYAQSIVKLDTVLNSLKSYNPSPLRLSYGLKTQYNEQTQQMDYSIYDENIVETDGSLNYNISNPYSNYQNSIQENAPKNNETITQYFTRGKSGDGEYTYEEILQNIAKAIDAHFFIIDDVVNFVSFNALFANISAWDYKTNKLYNNSKKAALKSFGVVNIEMWQILNDSFQYDINQYGMINTVEVKYKDGTVETSYEDLVRMYGIVKETYDEPELSYDAAMLKAEAYLSAHVRDFNMEVKASVIGTGKLFASSFIRIKNPLTMSDNLLFIHGISTSWEAGGSTIISDLDLRFGPENPDDLEVPEVGTGGYTNASAVSGPVSPDVATAAQQICGGTSNPSQKLELIYSWFKSSVPYRLYYNSQHSVGQTLQGTASNCVDTTQAFYELCTASGIQCEIWTGTLYGQTGTWGHWWAKAMYNGSMQIIDLGRGNKRGIGQYSGRLVGSCKQKNY